MFNDVLKQHELNILFKDKYEETEECFICRARCVNKDITCENKKCPHHLCAICLNTIKSYAVCDELYKTDGCGIYAIYKCPFCKNEKNHIPFSKLNKEDLLTFIHKDYNNFRKLYDETVELRYDYLNLYCEKNNLEVNQYTYDEYVAVEEVKKLYDKLTEDYVKILDENIKNREKDIIIANLEVNIEELQKQTKELIEKNRKMTEQYNIYIASNNIKSNVMTYISMQQSVVFKNLIDIFNKNPKSKTVKKKDIEKYLKTLANVEIKL